MKKSTIPLIFPLLLSGCAITLSNSSQDSTQLISSDIDSTDILDTTSNSLIFDSSNNSSSVISSPSNPVSSSSSSQPISSSIIEDVNPYQINTIPSLYITTPKTIDQKEYVEGTTAEIIDTVNSKNSLAKTTSKTKCRGNSSFGLVNGKYSYKIKFDEKVNIFGFGANKNWNLLANYLDRSYLRNYLTYKTAELLDSLNDFQVSSKFVELYINNEYRGLYLLTESVETGKSRLDIEVNYTAADTQLPFLLELDNKVYDDGLKENVDYFMSNGNPFAMKYPENLSVLTSTQQSYIKNSINTLYQKASQAKSNNDWMDYIDQDSFIDYFLVQELFRNPDIGHSSCFIYQPLGGKIKMGPIWDFDLALGNYSDWNLDYTPTGFVNQISGQPNALYNYLMKNSTFKTNYITRWNYLVSEIMPLMKTYLQELSTNTTFVNAANRDNNKWKTWGNYVPGLANNPNIIQLTSINANINYLVGYIYDGIYTSRSDNSTSKSNYPGRITWLNSNLSNYNL